MKIDAMIEWSSEERTAKRKEWTQSLFTLRLQKATGQLENPMKIRELKKDLARLSTLDHMKTVPAPKPAAAHGEPAATPPVAEKKAAPSKKAPAKKAATKTAAPAKAAPKAPAKKSAGSAKAGKADKADKKVKA